MNDRPPRDEPSVNIAASDHAAADRVRSAAYTADSDMAKILVVEDEPSLVDALTYSLADEGHDVASVTDGNDALAAIQRERPDLVLLDLMLPGLAGTEVCRQVRATSAVPIIILTAKDGEVDRVVGLELGADDYVTKPFSMRELTARVHAVLRRGSQPAHVEADAAPLEVAGVRLDPDRYEVTVNGRPVELPPKEFALLQLLLHNAGRVLTREVLIDRVWGADYVGDTKTLDVHIKRLRHRVERDPHHPEVITTVRGVGYKVVDP